MSGAGARAYNGDLIPAGSRGRAPGGGLKLKACFLTVSKYVLKFFNVK